MSRLGSLSGAPRGIRSGGTSARILARLVDPIHHICAVDSALTVDPGSHGCHNTPGKPDPPRILSHRGSYGLILQRTRPTRLTGMSRGLPGAPGQGSYQDQFRRKELIMRQVVVTGGGTGIGLAVASEFVRAGDSVTVSGRREHVLEEAADRLAAMGTAGYACLAPATRRRSRRRWNWCRLASTCWSTTPGVTPTSTGNRSGRATWPGWPRAPGRADPHRPGRNHGGRGRDGHVPRLTRGRAPDRAGHRRQQRRLPGPVSQPGR
jgi:hypothetical protein